MTNVKYLKQFLFILLLTPLFITGQTATILSKNQSAQLIPMGALWKYLDDGSNQGTAWQSADFNDSSWSEGNAQLGFGDSDESTVLNNNSYITFYFRKTFNVQSPSISQKIILSLLRDDGAVIYINGIEVLRSNMPTGTITSTTFASNSVGDEENDIYPFTLSSSILKEGENCIAAEVHQISTSSSDVSFDMDLNFGDYSLFQKAPYLLYTGKNNEMLVLWQMLNSTSCVIKLGTDTTYSLASYTTVEYGNSHQHKITLTGLNLGTKYYYKVIADSISYKTGSFFTGAADSDKKVSFFIYGDTRTYPSRHNLVAKIIMEDIESDPQAQTFIISSGDIVTEGDSESDWQDEFFDSQYEYIQQMLSQLPYISSMGNHEGQGLLFSKYFPYPIFKNNRYYYSFDYGPVHIAIIDQFANYFEGSTQYNWLVNDLAASNKPWEFIILHKPGWSAGGNENDTQVQDVIQPLCKIFNVKFVFSGHNHYYARAVVDDVMHITSAGGGASLYDTHQGRDSIVKTDKSNHYCKINISDDDLGLIAIRSDGSIIEAFTVKADKREFAPTNAGFIADSTNINTGKVVNFTDTSTNNPILWSWAFDGGIPQTSSNQNPKVIYSNPGVYDVTLISTNADGIDTLTMKQMITVSQISGINSSNNKGLNLLNYPNPFAKSTTISYTITKKSYITLYVYNVFGKLVDTLVKESQQKGSYNVEWDASNLASGIYLYKLQSDSHSVVKKMLIK